MISNVKRGADPELFLVDGSGTPVSSIGRVGGSKNEPRPIGDGYALQEDNVAVEFNIPPASSRDEFIHSIQHVIHHLEDEMSQQGLLLAIVPTLDFDKESLDHPQARAMGCEPDYNAWTGKENPRPKAPKAMRSAGGHLHISWDDPTMDIRNKIIQAHDLFCGAPSIRIDHDDKRRSLYGRAGACRYKEYGVEYRTPSNFWIKSQELIDWMYTQSEKAIAFLNRGGEIDKDDFSKIQDCINTSNYNLLDELSKKYAI